MTPPLREALLVDDSDGDNYLHRRLILRSGLVQTVTVTQGGTEALAYLQQAAIPPDILLLDINMPDMDGWEFLDHFDNLPVEKRSPILVAMLSTSSNLSDRVRAESNSNVEEFSSKELTKQFLETLVQRCVDLHG
ncbi:MAG: CheY-like chemotaxis protein [Myxococcota bacterium]|jgi:CheY-like chemotaxis protein